jgi:hypothetical protein
MQRYLDDKWLALIALNLITFMAILFKSYTVTTPTTDLSPVTTQLTNISTKLDAPSSSTDLKPITKELTQLKNLIQQLQNKDSHQLGDLFSTGQDEIKKQLSQVANLLAKLDEQKHPIKRLPASKLPFKVISIDSIQDSSVASVAYNYKTQAIEQGDSLAGWKVIQLNFAKQLVEFENSDKSHVLVHLKGKDSSDA